MDEAEEEPQEELDGYRYNDDLLITEEARKQAGRDFPTIFPFLDFPALRKEFLAADKPANRSKRVSHVAGFWALVLGLVALSVAATEPVWHHQQFVGKPAQTIIVVVASLCGVAAFLIGAVGILHGQKKDAWLRERLKTERIRAYHFQSFIWRLPEIVKAIRENNFSSFNQQRGEALAALTPSLSSKAELHKVLYPEGPPEVFLHKGAGVLSQPAIPSGATKELDEIFRAYRALRFGVQHDYATHVLRSRNDPALTAKAKKRFTLVAYPGITQPMRRKKLILDYLWWGSLLTVVVVDLLALVTPGFSLFGRDSNAFWNWFHDPTSHVVVVLFALLAVAIKTLKEGFAIDQELDRFEEYRVTIVGLRATFDQAKTPEDKVRVMMEMEKAAFEELRRFLRSNHEAKFVL
ncbi:MAG: hypothetical protein ABL994_02445 [Verrucomicrobiales bacterium]